jgi:hypothetical protein
MAVISRNVITDTMSYCGDVMGNAAVPFALARTRPWMDRFQTRWGVESIRLSARSLNVSVIRLCNNVGKYWRTIPELCRRSGGISTMHRKLHNVYDYVTIER